MRGESRKKKKSDKTWLRQALTDLIVGIILLVIQKLLKQRRGAKALLLVKLYHTHLYKINMSDALKFLGVFFITLAFVKLAIGLICIWRDKHASRQPKAPNHCNKEV